MVWDVKRRSVDALLYGHERLTMDDFIIGRRRLNKYWGEIIRQDMTHFYLIEDIITLDRRL